jgi:acetate---CoA ligase (ADP-forming)
VPAFAAVRNPLDVTGHVLANPRLTALTAIDHALDAALADPGLDFVLFCGVTIPDVRPPDEGAARLAEERVRWLGERIASAPIPVIPMGTTCVDVSAYARELMNRHGVHLLGGIDLGMLALGHTLRWLENRSVGRPPAYRRPAGNPARNTATRYASGPWPEAAVRDLLAACAVPLVPAELVTTAEAATRAARRLGSPVALKVCSAQITHKSDIGGVALGVHGDARVRDACRRMLAAGQTVPGAVVDACWSRRCGSAA